MCRSVNGPTIWRPQRVAGRLLGAGTAAGRWSAPQTCGDEWLKVCDEEAQPVEQDGQAHHDHQRPAHQLDAVAMPDQRSGDGGRLVDRDREQEEGDAQAQGVGHQQQRHLGPGPSAAM